MNRFEIIKRPLDTEKLDRMRDRENKFAFEIDMKANKTEIKQAIEALFKVKVVTIKTAIVRGKFGRNVHGRMTTPHRGGGHKQRMRIVDWKREKDGVPAKVAAIEYDPNRSARLALLHYTD